MLIVGMLSVIHYAESPNISLKIVSVNAALTKTNISFSNSFEQPGVNVMKPFFTKRWNKLGCFHLRLIFAVKARGLPIRGVSERCSTLG